MVEVNTTESMCRQSVGIIGAGTAGLIMGYTLLHDGFQNVQLLTRDKSVGGVWAKERVYPGVSINRRVPSKQ
jgi:dimethylaniline monooxygenase (N-oxide forming)